MVFGKKEQDKPEMEVIEEEIEAAETELELVKQEKQDVIEASAESEEDAVEIIVVKELPTQPVRYTTKEDGTKVKFMTVEESLAEILNS